MTAVVTIRTPGPFFDVTAAAYGDESKAMLAALKAKRADPSKEVRLIISEGREVTL